jgi:hypothetical protein
VNPYELTRDDELDRPEPKATLFEPDLNAPDVPGVANLTGCREGVSLGNGELLAQAELLRLGYAVARCLGLSGGRY